MPTFDEVRDQLKQFVEPNWSERRLEVAHGLPQPLRTLVEVVIKNESPRILEAVPLQPIRIPGVRLAEYLDTCSPAERQRIFAVFFPHLAGHIEGAWRLLCRQPYTSGWGSQPYRLPNTPSATCAKRGLWFRRLLQELRGYDPDIHWVATWAPHVMDQRMYVEYPSSFGELLAAAIDAGGCEGEGVYRILCESARGEHPIGGMGRHVIAGMLSSASTEAWQFIEGMLLAAEREEGLRQAILCAAHLGHPGGFHHILRVVLDHDLARFGATIEAVKLWFADTFDASGKGVVKTVLESVAALLVSPEERAEVCRGDDGARLYIGLWSQAFLDARPVFDMSRRLLDDSSAERRLVGTRILGELGTEDGFSALLPVLDDTDLRVVQQAVVHLHDRLNHELHYRDGNLEEERPLAEALGEKPESSGDPLVRTDLFERLERLLPRVAKPRKAAERLLWWDGSIPREVVSEMLVDSLGERLAARLIRHLPHLSPNARDRTVSRITRTKPWGPEVRRVLIELAGDSSPNVREGAIGKLKGDHIEPGEAPSLEKLLTRKEGVLRRGVLSLLHGQSDRAVLESVDRLLDSRCLLQRVGGLELLRMLVESSRATDECRQRAESYRGRHDSLSDEESRQLDVILKADRAEVTADDAFGLVDPARGTVPPTPRKRGVVYGTPAMEACLKSLLELLKVHKGTPVTVRNWDNTPEDMTLGEPGLAWRFPRPDGDVPVQEDATRLPLHDLWEQWWRERPAETRDSDGLELLRCCAETIRLTRDREEGALPELMKLLLTWLLRLYPPERAVDFAIDAFEHAYAAYGDNVGNPLALPLLWGDITRSLRELKVGNWRVEHDVRVWQIRRWAQLVNLTANPRFLNTFQARMQVRLQEDCLRHDLHVISADFITLEEMLAAFAAGAANETDLLLYLVEMGGGLQRHWRERSPLFYLTALKSASKIVHYDLVRPIAEKLRDRIVGVELDRGDNPTAASELALHLRSSGGLDALVRLLQGFERLSFVRGRGDDRLGKAGVYSHLIRVTYPGSEDTFQRFAARVKHAGISEKRLVELAVYAPQWAGHVEHTLGWAGLEDGVWWLHAHTKDRKSEVEKEIRETWYARINEHTPLIGDELLDGAVDVAWFYQAYRPLGASRWAVLDEAAKLASGGIGHKRAQLFADAMRGEVSADELIVRIHGKRHLDAVRALGLVPLPLNPRARTKELLRRYQIMQEFLRTGQKSGGPQRRASEKLAVEIGMQNLSRLAGYPDPLRLEWAMEAAEVADLARGPVSVTVGLVKIQLALDEQGQPELTVIKSGKTLQSVPPSVRKSAKVVAISERKTRLKRQVARIRQSLEQSMCRGDIFTAGDLRELFDHPVLAPQLGATVLLGDGIIGYPIKGGRVIEDHAGRSEPVRKTERFRIAHPYDLLATNEWHLWQRECFVRERIQPFKQVFRELYVLTEQEQSDGTVSHRYAGHQVASRQAVGLLGNRGWVSPPEEGVRRVFHREGFIAWIGFLEWFHDPRDVETLTLDEVRFFPRGDYRPIPLAEVPPRIFSEVMRDIDLMVSVAHRSGVAPEATASTVEMRAALLRELCQVLKLTNVQIKDRHALIRGQLSDYRVHLGSAIVHRLPGGQLCIVPVHTQHRGRLFLPFADDDPKTAEVASKVLLLARDKDIKDPSILTQIRRA